MTLFGLLGALIVVGVLLYLLNSFVPMDPKVKTIINVVVILLLVAWLLRVFFGDALMRIRLTP